MPSDIREARRLVRLARLWIQDGETEEALELLALAERLMHRDRPLRVTKPRSDTMTAQKAAAIKRYFAAFPNASLQQIANLFRVNQARVSEALHGVRWNATPRPPPTRLEGGLF